MRTVLISLGWTAGVLLAIIAWRRLVPAPMPRVFDFRDFSIRHFWEKATEDHGFALSYTWTRLVLQAAGFADKAPARGKYRRQRERRPLRGMLVHLDASTHRWLPALPMADLVVALDDASRCGPRSRSVASATRSRSGTPYASSQALRRHM